VRRSLLLACATLLATFACAQRAAQTPPRLEPAGIQAADTLRGTVRMAGAEPAASVTLEAGRAGAVVLAGERAVLEQLSGIEVTVWGERQAPGRFDVARVAVRAVAGTSAVDGVLQRSGDVFVLLTTDGQRLPLPHLPPDLRTRIGARIWLAGPLDRAPDAYGVIR
jgi:hypothetical protein